MIKLITAKKETSVIWAGLSLWMVFVLAFMAVFSYGLIVFTAGFGADEREHLHAAFLVYSGQVPYRDFFQHHHPLFWYLLQPFLYFFGSSPYVWFWARGLVCLLSCGIVYFIYKISVLAGTSRKEAFLAAISWFLFYAVRRSGSELRPDLLMILFYLAGSYCFFYYLKCLRYGYCLAAFVLFFCSFLTLQKIIFVLAGQGVVILWLLYKKKMVLMDVLLASGSVFVLALLCCIALYQVGALKDYFELNWALNLKIRIMSLIAEEDYYVFVFMAVLAAGVLICSTNEVMRIISFLYLFMCVFLIIWRPWFYQYLLPYCALGVIICSYVLWEPLLKFRIHLLVLVMLAGFCAVRAYDTWEFSRKDFFRLETYTAWLDFLLKNTQPDDMVLCNGEDMISTMRRSALGYYWFSVGFVSTLDSKVYQRHELPNYDLIIKTRRPKVVMNGFWRDCSLGDKYIANRDCPFWESIDKVFLEEHYKHFGFAYIRKD